MEGKAFALHAANRGSTSDTTYGLSSTIRSIAWAEIQGKSLDHQTCPPVTFKQKVFST